jgi:hypothetical protein
MDGCPSACFRYWTTPVLSDMLTSSGALVLAGCESDSLGSKGGGTEARRVSEQSLIAAWGGVRLWGEWAWSADA